MKTLAILDNEQNILTVFSLMLEKKGYRVFTAEDIESCRNILKSEKIDVLIAEYLLPDADVPQFIRELRKERNYEGLPVIFLSGYGTHDAVKSAMRSGGSEFLHKPCRIDRICETVERHIHSEESPLNGKRRI